MNFISEDFHLHYISNYSLYIQSDFINDYLVVVNEENEVLVYMTYDNLEPSQEATKLLSLPFSQVCIGLPHQNLVWVASEVYDETEQDLYKDYFVDSNQILSKEIVGLDIVGLYQYDLLMYNRWKNLFPEAIFTPNFEVILRQAQPQIPIRGEVLGVHVYDSQADIFLFLDGELKLYNTFEVSIPDDLSYFVLNLFKNFNLTGKVQKTILSGVDGDSEWGHRLLHYTDTLVVSKAKNKWTVQNAEIAKVLDRLNVLVDSGVCV